MKLLQNIQIQTTFLKHSTGLSHEIAILGMCHRHITECIQCMCWVHHQCIPLMHQSLAGAAPTYLADDCHLLSDAGCRPLRSHSNDIRKLLVPRTHNKLGDRSFSAAGLRLWNDLPPGLRRPGLSFDSFRRSLKTHLFGD